MALSRIAVCPVAIAAAIVASALAGCSSTRTATADVSSPVATTPAQSAPASAATSTTTPTPTATCTTPTGTYRGPVQAQLTSSQGGSVVGTFPGSGTISLTYANGNVTGTIAMTGGGTVNGGPSSGGLNATISGSAAQPIATGLVAGTGGNSPFHVQFPVNATCSSASGNIVSLFQSIYAFYGASSAVTVGGNGAWTIPHIDG